MRQGDDEADHGRGPAREKEVDHGTDNIKQGDWDDAGGGGGGHGMTAKSFAAGFSPVRYQKSRQHSLDIDPRTKLRIINVPAERRVQFADMHDLVIHVFLDCFKITSSDQYADRVLVITDQTLFLCTRDGAVGRCLQVDRIKTLFVNNDNKALAIEIPSEFDILLKFPSAAERDRVIKVLRTVYRRMTHNRLQVEAIKKGRKMDHSNFKVSKPDTFRLTLIPQRTKENLRQMLEVFEQQEEAMLEEIDMIQDEMEVRHQQKMSEMQGTLESNLAKANNAVKEAWDNEAKLTKLRDDVGRARKLIEQVDGAFTPEGEPPISKDQQIAELELVVSRLNAAVYASGSEGIRRGGEETGATTTYFNKDLESDLYRPAWPGAGGGGGAAAAAAAASGKDGGELSSLADMLKDQIRDINIETEKTKQEAERVGLIEGRMRFVDERIAYLRHMRRTGKFDEEMASGGGKGKKIKGLGGGGGGGGAGGAASSPSRGAARGETEVHDKAYAWLAELPQDITIDSLTIDPRTGLHMVDLPDVMRPYFVDASKAVIHLFSVVRKTSKSGEVVKRVVLVSDQALYLCTPNGIVKRCVAVPDIDELLIDTSFGVGLRTKDKYDLSFQCVTTEHRQELLDILQRLFRFASGGRAIPVREVPKHQRLEAVLTLVPPAGYVMQLVPFLTRQELVDAIKQKREVVVYNAPISDSAGSAMPADMKDKMSEEQYLRIRTDVAKQMDYEWRQDTALVQLRAQIDALEKQLRISTEEVQQLKQAIDQHRCEDGIGFMSGSFPLAAGTGVLPTSGAGVYRPQAEGLFFINVEPVIINCDLAVNKVVMSHNNFFTGHSNGFIHIWDLANSGHSHVRTLRDHTMTITDLDVNGPDLLSSSGDGTIRKWDLGTGRCTTILQGHRGAVNTIRRDGSRLISGGNDAIVNVWDLEKGTTVSRLNGHKSSIKALRFEADMMVSIEWGWALFWDLRSAKIVRTLRDEQGGINCLDYAQGIAVAGSTGGDITVWDVAKGTGDTISGHTDDIEAIQLAGKSAVTAGGDGKIRMWDMASLKSLGVFHDAGVYSIKTFHMEGKRFAAGMGCYVKLWTK